MEVSPPAPKPWRNLGGWGGAEGQIGSKMYDKLTTGTSLHQILITTFAKTLGPGMRLFIVVSVVLRPRHDPLDFFAFLFGYQRPNLQLTSTWTDLTPKINKNSFSQLRYTDKARPSPIYPQENPLYSTVSSFIKTPFCVWPCWILILTSRNKS